MICAVISSPLAATAATAPEPPLRLEVGSWPPLIDFSAPQRGSLSQTVNAAFAKAQRETVIREVSWKTAEAHLDQGRTLSFGWIMTAERQRRWRFSDPICSTVTVLVRRADHAPLNRLDEIRDQRVGWSRGYSYGERFDTLRPQMQVEEMPNDEVGLRHLLLGTVDFMPMETLVARALIARVFSPEEGAKLVIDSSPAHVILRTPLHMVCRIGAQACDELIASFNQGLRTARGGDRVPSCAE